MEFKASDLKLMTAITMTLDEAKQQQIFKDHAAKENTFEAGYQMACGIIATIGFEIAMSALKSVLEKEKKPETPTPAPPNPDMH